MDANSKGTEKLAAQSTETINVDTLPEESRVIYLEIQKIREARKKSCTDITNCYNKLQEEKKQTNEKKAIKASLEKEISELRCYVENETYQKSLVGNQIDEMRKLSKTLGDSTICNDETLEICLNSKQKAMEALGEQNTKMTKNLTNMQSMFNSKELEVQTLNETVLTQREVYKDHLKKCEDEQLRISEKINKSKNDLNIVNKRFDELKAANETCLSKTVVAEKENELLLQQLEQKQKCADKLLKEIEEQQHNFEQDNSKLSKDLDDCTYEIQKKVNEIHTLERAIKNQQNFNESLKEKIKWQEDQNAKLQDHNEEREKLKNLNGTEFSDNEKLLQETIASKLIEIENLKATCAEENITLSNTVQAVVVGTKVNNELIQQFEQCEALVCELKAKRDVSSQNLASLQEYLSSTLPKQEAMGKELEELQAKTKVYELESTESLENAKLELSETLAEIEKIKIEDQETAKSIFQQMNSIKIDFDVKTSQQTSIYEEKEKQFEDEIQKVEKEYQTALLLQVSHDEQLKRINEECDSIKHKIKNFENLNHILASFSALEDQMMAPTVPTVPTPRTQLHLPLSGSNREKGFDELSGSSAEGHTVTYQQVLEYRERKRQQQLRKQQRLQGKTFNPGDRSLK